MPRKLTGRKEHRGGKVIARLRGRYLGSFADDAEADAAIDAAIELMAERARAPNDHCPIRQGLASAAGDRRRGRYPTGALAVDWLVRRANGVHVIGFPLPAPWGEFGKGAGPRRNSEMVAVLGSLRRMGAITRCIGYPMPGGRGTRDCMGKAGGFSHEVLNHGTDGGAT